MKVPRNEDVEKDVWHKKRDRIRNDNLGQGRSGRCGGHDEEC